MKSSPAASASLATARQSGQLADQRSGTLVAERPDEQLAPNRPILSALPLYMAMRFFIEAWGASTAVPPLRRSCRCRRAYSLSPENGTAGSYQRVTPRRRNGAAAQD